MKTIYNKLLLFLLLLPFGALAQGTVSGTVLDRASGQSLPGVNVVVEGTTNGTSTDFDGKFQLSNVSNGAVIVFSYVGFKDATVTYTGQSTVSVSLEEDANQLNEVVVQIGYGTINRRTASTAVTTVTSEQFQKGPIVGAEQLIQGRVSGVQVTTGNGEPGGGSQVRIRSGASLSTSNDPLYVIDNVVIDAGATGIRGGRNPLATINPYDIASMTILKDAAATAIYGSRASNGVVIITTKRGQSGEMKVTYNGNFQVNEINDYVDVMDATQYRAYVMQNGSEAQQALLGTSDTNWQKQIYRTGLGTDHNISLSGGTDDIVYRTSVGYTNINGVLKKDNFERSTINASVVGNFFDKHVRVELNSKSAVMQNIYGNRDAIGAAVTFDPTQSISQPGGNAYGGYFQWVTGDAYEVNAGRNPVSLLEQVNRFGTSFRSIGNLQLEYKIHSFEELKLVGNFGHDNASGRTYGNTEMDFIVPSQAGSYYDQVEDKNMKIMDLYFNYNKTFDIVNLDVTGGYTYQDTRYHTGGETYDPTNEVVNPDPTRRERVNLQSFFGRATVSIADKYILNGSFRADGSSRFAEENRWGYFPAVSAAWRVGQESIFKDSKFLDELKLRASWGATGQQESPRRYPSYALYETSTSTAGYQFGYDAQGNPLFYQTVRPLAYNQDLKWEETEMTNLGLDFAVLNNRVNGSVEVYRSLTKDLIVFSPNPQGVNFSNAADYNVGRMENKGLEMMLEVYPVKNDNLQWRVGGNITFQESKITKLVAASSGGAGLATGGISGGTGSTIQNHQVGFAPSSFFVFEQAYDTNGLPIEDVYVDRNQDGLINEDDKYRFHKPAADYFYGFNTDVTYKNWWLSMSFRGSEGNYMYNNVASNLGNQAIALPSNGNYLNNAHTSALTTNFVSQRLDSDYYIQDASFIRMDNVSLGYTFKNVFDEGSTLMVTGAVQNVFVVTDYDGLDPEINGGIDNNFYPRPTTYTLGLNINF